jgi:predicted DsbA family dithiol-disulfide isomerase
MQIEVWSDVVCPWCYIGKRRLETALEQFPHRDQVEVVWRSFQLDPTIPEGETFPALPALAQKYGRPVDEMRAMQARVEEMAAGEGLRYDLANGISGNTLLAHELIHLAAGHGRGGEMKERLLHAHFEEGRPVFSVDDLVPLAVEVGLDEAEVREVLAGRRDRAGARRDRRPLLRRRPEVRRRRCPAGRAAAAGPRARLGRRPPAGDRPRRRRLRRRQLRRLTNDGGCPPGSPGGQPRRTSATGRPDRPARCRTAA